MFVRGAVDAAAHLAHGVDVQHHHLAARIQIGKDVCGFGIGFFVAEFSRDHRAVADVIIDVGRHEIRAVDADVVRLGQFDQFQRVAFGIGGGFQNICPPSAPMVQFGVIA